MALLKTAPGVSRVHASRRVFEALQQQGVDIPVIHHIAFSDGTDREGIILTSGGWGEWGWGVGARAFTAGHRRIIIVSG